MSLIQTAKGVVLLIISLSPHALGQKDAKSSARTAQSSVRLVRTSERRLVTRTENVRFTTTGYGPWRLYDGRFVTMDNGGNCCYTRITVKAFDLAPQASRFSVGRSRGWVTRER